MKVSSMYRGEFKLKNSPYPDLQLKDWPSNDVTRDYLAKRVEYFGNPDCEVAIPQPMLAGLHYKLRYVTSDLKKDRAKLRKHWLPVGVLDRTTS